ncbi:MAG: hypothetical protein H7336_16670 [Bacteriovorax sp.]|nr:hypothetical protein [Bacteriovorax sp.]
MKTIAALLLVLVSASASAYVPLYDVARTDAGVELTITNDNEKVQLCSYRFSWFEGMTYKKFNGKISMLPDEVKVFEVKLDIAIKVQNLKSAVECE